MQATHSLSRSLTHAWLWVFMCAGRGRDAGCVQTDSGWWLLGFCNGMGRMCMTDES